MALLFRENQHESAGDSFFQLHSTHSGAMCVVGTGKGWLAAFLAGPEKGTGFEGGFIVLRPSVFKIPIGPVQGQM